MARDGSVLVKFLADTLGFRKGTDDMSRALADAATDTKTSTTHMSDAFRTAGAKIDATTKDVGKNTKRGMRDAGKEGAHELIQNMSEGIASGKVSMTDAALGTIGGIAPALGAAGVGIAIAASLLLTIKNGLDEQKKKAHDMALMIFDGLREGMLDAAAKESILEKALGVDNMMDAFLVMQREAATLGVNVNDVVTYLDSAGRVSTPALSAALADAKKQGDAVGLSLAGVNADVIDAAAAITDQAVLTKKAYDDAAGPLATLALGAERVADAIRMAKEQQILFNAEVGRTGRLNGYSPGTPGGSRS